MYIMRIIVFFSSRRKDLRLKRFTTYVLLSTTRHYRDVRTYMFLPKFSYSHLPIPELWFSSSAICTRIVSFLGFFTYGPYNENSVLTNSLIDPSFFPLLISCRPSGVRLPCCFPLHRQPSSSNYDRFRRLK